MEGDTITHEERKRLDRQRFIGWETQKKYQSTYLDCSVPAY